MNDLPEYLTVAAAVILIATRSKAACLKAFEAEDGEVAVPDWDFGLGVADRWIAEHRQPGLLSIEGKSAQNDIQHAIKCKSAYLDIEGDHFRCRLRAPDTPKHDYESSVAKRKLLQALAAKEIIAYTVDPDNAVREIDAALWLGREFDYEVRDGHYNVVAVAAGHEPLRRIRFKKEDIFQKCQPEGDQVLSSKVPKSERHQAAEESLLAWAPVLQSKPVAGAYQRKRGPRSHKREAVEASMTKAIREGCLTADSLRKMFEKELAFRYGVSRDTARKARNNVLGQLGL